MIKIENDYLCSPNFMDYAKKQLELHRLIRNGKADSDEADEIRSELDPLWIKLSQDEKTRIRLLSKELYAEENLPSEIG